MSAERPEDAAARIREDIDVLSERLVRLSQNLQALSASLDTSVPETLQVAPVAPVAQTLVAPTPAPAFVPAPPRPAPVIAPRPLAPARPRKEWSVAEIFSIVGSAITLIGVALVLMMPQDGFMGPISRTAIGLGLAAAAVVAAIWQHRADPKNIGAQALLATGIASTFLCLVALTAVFHHPDGRPLLGVLPGLVAAGLVSLIGVWMAGQWRSQWLAVLAVLGSLVLAPFLGENTLISLSFMTVMMLATGFFQRGFGWAGLVLARTLPTGLFALPVMGAPVIVSDDAAFTLLPHLGLATAIAIVGLIVAYLHQDGTPSERTAAVASMALLATPLLLIGWHEGDFPSIVLFVLVGGLFTAVGFLRMWFADLVRQVALPLGAVYLASTGLVALDARWRGMVFLVLAISYLVVAAQTRFRLVLVVGSALGLLGAVAWLPTVSGLFTWQLVSATGRLGLTDVFTSLLVLAAGIAGARAYREFFPARWVGIHWATWAVALISGSVAVVLGGTLLGLNVGQSLAGFQIAHAVVTVTWMGLCVFLLSRALRADDQATGSLWLAIALAAAAVAKLFLFDLGTLPGLARALAFLAVGVLLLIVGTWYNRQLEKVRRARPVVASAADVPGQTAARMRILFVGAMAEDVAGLVRGRVGDHVDVRSAASPDPGLLFHADRVIVLGDTPVEPVPGMRGSLERWETDEHDLDGHVSRLVGALLPL